MTTIEVLARLTAHWPMLGGDDAAARVRLEDWQRVVERNDPHVRAAAIEALVNGWTSERPPKIADWQETTRQVIHHRPELSAPSALEAGARCLYCEGTGWLWHSSGRHETIGNSMSGPRFVDATEDHPILERCTCGVKPRRPAPDEHIWTEEEMAHNRARIAALIASARDVLTNAQRKIAVHGYDLAPRAPSIHDTTDLPGGPPLGEKHMTPEERQAELEAFGDRKVRRKRLT